jgi:alpha-tubulin suppressor-like RCC1 family protein
MEELRNHRACQIVAGQFHCAALTEDGALFTWETARELEAVTGAPVPELGYGSFVHEVGVPHRVFALEGVRIASVAVGNGFTVAFTEGGAVYSFGVGDERLGHGEGNEEEDVFLPKRITALDGLHVATVAAGRVHALALTRCGRVYSWGAINRDNPVHVFGNGSNDGGDGGDRDEDYYSIPRSITALLGQDVRAIATGWCVSYAVTAAGALYTWGENASGSLGHGDNRDWDRPMLVQALQGIRVVGVSIHDVHTLALAADGSVYAFGKGPGLGIRRGSEGEAVDGTTPQRIPELVCMVPR